MSTLENYYASNPVEIFDRNRWNIWDPVIASLFHQTAQWTPLMGFVDLSVEGSSTYFTTATQALPGHVNHNELTFRTDYVNPMYWDTRQKKLTGLKQWGQKVQVHKFDNFLNMWKGGGMSTEQLLYQMARRQLAYSVVETMEKIVRDTYIKWCAHKHYGPHGEYADFSEISRSESDTFDVNILPEIKGALSKRVAWRTGGLYGDYTAPVPGSSNTLVLTTPGVVSDIWNQRNDFMVDLRTLQDQRILNGAMIDYQGFTFVEGNWARTMLYNAGNINKQVAVISAIHAGDGAKDPDVGAVDDVYYTGQSGSSATHYVQCSPFDDGDFLPGDEVSIHFLRTADWGITDGCDFLDGQTIVAEILSVNHVDDQITFRMPITANYTVDKGECTTLAGASPSPAISHHYAYITKAQHIHPVLVAPARGAHVFAMTQPVKFYEPVAIDDFNSVWRFTWDMYGAPNRWEPDLYDIYFVAGSDYKRGQNAEY